MEIVSLSSTNYIGLTSNYPDDKRLIVDQNVLYTENGVDIPLVAGFNNVNDNTINNYSNLFLTNKIVLSSFAYIEDLAPIQDFGFSTFLAVNGYPEITETTIFLTVTEPDVTQNTAKIALTGSLENIDNTYMFDINFLNDRLCKVSHSNKEITRYMTVDYTGNIIFAKDCNCDPLQDLSPQIFYYVFDRASEYILLLKNINDIVKYVGFDPIVSSTPTLTLIDPITAADIPYTSRCILRCVPRNQDPNNTILTDSWVSYNKDFKINSQGINPNRSYSSVPGNLLINSQYYNTTGTNMDVNILSLKNTSTPENYQYRANPFRSNNSPLFTEKEVENREYKKLLTGSNQKYGNDNIVINYEAYTTDIILKSDKITYFHIPQLIDPYVQLNISESGLIESGAIAGDHPLKSDKIFKKESINKYSSPFGAVKDEATGSFLCSWLSGNHDVNTKPIWVDRYYNPLTTSFFAALTTTDFQSIKYESVNECLFNVVDLIRQVDVFDKPSDLIFEPGAYYAYYRYGLSGVNNFINSLSIYREQKDLSSYLTIYDQPVVRNNAVPDEYIFNGKNYGLTNGLSAIQETGQMTLSFWANNADWTKPFGNQIVGNYVNDGVGIFNENTVTPTVFIPGSGTALSLNSNLLQLKSLNYNGDEITASIRYDGVSNYYLIFKSGQIFEYNNSDTSIRKVTDSKLLNLINYDYTTSSIYLLCSAAPGANSIIQINTPTLAISDITNISLNAENNNIGTPLMFANDPDAGWLFENSQQDLLLSATTINFYNNKLFFTPGTKSRLLNDTIYYLSNNQKLMLWKNLNHSTSLPVITAFQSRSQIQDFNIDFDNNIWILSNNNEYYKYTSDRQFVLSGTLDGTSFINHKIDFLANFENGAYTKQAIIAQTGQIPIPKDDHINTVYDFITDDGSKVLQDGYSDTLVFNTYQELSAAGLFLTTIDLYNGIANSTATLPSETAVNIDFTSCDYQRKITSTVYNGPTINAKCTLVNVFNPYDTDTFNIISSLSGLDPGYHHFALRVDTYAGQAHFFINGQIVGSEKFPQRKYQFNNFSRRPFLVGSTSYGNSSPLFKYLNNNEELVENLKIKHFNVYSAALMDADIMMLAKQDLVIQDLHFNVPCGRRNYLEEIERYFKNRTPNSKSTFYNIIIQNSGITDSGLRTGLEARIVDKLKQLAPAYTKLNTIKWIN